MAEIEPIRVKFEWDSDGDDSEPYYEHKHALRVTEDFEYTAHEFAGQLDAQTAQIEAQINQQMMAAGLTEDDIDVEFDVEMIDDTTVGVRQRLTGASFEAGVAGEVSQLLSLLTLVDEEGVAGSVMEMVEGMTEGIDRPDPS